MPSLTLSKVLILLFALLYLLTPALAKKGYPSTCRLIGLRDDWYNVEFCCTYTSDAIHERKNVLDLGHFIANRHGNLVWQDNGGYHDTCGSCHLYDDFMTLGCNCYNGYPPPETEHWTMLESSLERLGDRLVNENGNLVCKDNCAFNAETMGDC